MAKAKEKGTKEKGKSDVNFDTKVGEKDRLLLAICYFFTVLGGIFLYIVKGKESKAYVFHAYQTMVIGIILILISFTGIGAIISFFAPFVLAYLAYRDADFRLSPISEFVAQHV